MSMALIVSLALCSLLFGLPIAAALQLKAKEERARLLAERRERLSMSLHGEDALRLSLLFFTNKAQDLIGRRILFAPETEPETRTFLLPGGGCASVARRDSDGLRCLELILQTHPEAPPFATWRQFVFGSRLDDQVERIGAEEPGRRSPRSSAKP